MKKLHKILILCLAAVMLLGIMAVPASAARGAVAKELYYKDIKVTLDGKALELNAVEPFIIDGTTYLPVRAISEALGLNVDWDGATGTVILTAPLESRDIYITRTGSKYHYNSTCNGGTYWPVPYDTAVGMGLAPCDKCVHG